uniref:Superoxide dismutase n=1 Tax=Ananas comosus var. bracteatus TaxID=296719 RepID=A0A6V7QJB7_ANACO|nr:unnamed protein product [Ananas comosus var. bracteatus]
MRFQLLLSPSPSSSCCGYQIPFQPSNGVLLLRSSPMKIPKPHTKKNFLSLEELPKFWPITALRRLRISFKRTLELHWGEHHRHYVDSLNKQLTNSPLYGYTMEELIKVTYNNGNPLPEFNNAAQVWNHDFFWESMQPDGGNLPCGGLLQQIEKDFGSFSNFRDEFVHSAMTLFGSGWVWLILKTNERRLSVVRTSNAICPLVWGDIPIICLDMWEVDKRTYAINFIDHLVSWHAVTSRMMRAEAFVNLGEPKIPVA